MKLKSNNFVSWYILVFNQGYYIKLTYLKEPRSVITVSEGNTRISRDDVLVNGEDGLRVHSNPCHLKQETKKKSDNFYFFI